LGGAYDAVVFDLLSALVDSWSLWNRVAGSETLGLAWRRRYLERTYTSGRYVPYEGLVEWAAGEVDGLPAGAAAELIRCWDELDPWPEAPVVLAALGERARLGVLTNCSEALGQRAAARTGGVFDVVVSAERAGWYKPHEQAYLVALDELNVDPSRTLFVAGSPYDIIGATGVGMSVYWHDRGRMPGGHAAARALAIQSSLEPLLDKVV
jgi:2-haloalkanoic acid dehalogenase type II